MENVVQFGGILGFAIAGGGIAAVLGIASLWLRHKEIATPWAQRLCLASDMLNTTFAAITVVGVLSISFNLVVVLPDLARKKDIPATPDLSGMATSEQVRQLTDDMRELRPKHSLMERLIEKNLASRDTIDRLSAALLQQSRLDLMVEGLIDGDSLTPETLTKAALAILGDATYFDNVHIESADQRNRWSCYHVGENITCEVPGALPAE